MELIDKVYEIIDLFEKSTEIQKFKQIKEKIEEDKELKELLHEIRKENISSDHLIDLKRKIITMPIVKKYKQMENELYFLSLNMNQKFKEIHGKKSCGL